MDIRYKLENMAETEYKIDYEFDYSTFNPEKLRIQVGHEIMPLIDRDKLIVKSKAAYVYDEGELILATETLAMTFCLSPISDVIEMKDDGTFKSSNALIIDTFLMASLGALRGVLMKNLKGTPLEKYYIPLIPVEKYRV